MTGPEEVGDLGKLVGLHLGVLQVWESLKTLKQGDEITAFQLSTEPAFLLFFKSSLNCVHFLNEVP